MNEIETNVQFIADDKENLLLDIYALQEQYEQQRDTIDRLESTVEQLERDKFKFSMRIFGLQENVYETQSDLKSKVINEVLKVACPSKKWETDSIIEAFRVGKRSDKNQRIIIVKFKSSDEKHLLYTGRDNLRDKGIRISEELTTRERDVINNLRQNGRTGYFYKG